MALLFMDSFDHYATADLLTKWTGQGAGSVWSINTSNGRHSSWSLRSTTASSVIYKRVAASGATAMVGCAVKFAVLSAAHKIIGIYDSVATRDQVYLQVNTNGSIAVYRGSASTGNPNVGAGTLLGTSAAAVIGTAAFYHIEAKILLSDTVGTVTVNVNGVAVLTLTTQDTSTGTLVWDTFWTHTGGGGALDWDDLWVCDGSGASPWNDLLGDARVDSVFPTGAGATTGWTPLSSTNVSNVDETSPDGDTTYNSTTTLAATDTFVVGDSPVVGATVLGVQSCISVRKIDAGTGTFATVTRHSSTDYPGTTQTLTTSYSYYLQMAQVNPGTSAAWTEAGFNAAEFGYRRIG